MSQETTPFPLYFDEPDDAWRWPSVPFEWSHRLPDGEAAQRCRIEDAQGREVEGELDSIEPGSAHLSFRTPAAPGLLRIPLGRVRRVTLIEPLEATSRIPKGRPEMLPVAAQEREVTLYFADDDATRLALPSMGCIERPEGLYLFPAHGHEDLAVVRVFVPRAALRGHVVGSTVKERAAERWLSEPGELLRAIDLQPQAPVLPIGQALLNLGLISPRQLERALHRQTGDKPLGQMLIDGALISRSDLYTALGHKMGYPLVDLSRFPVDRAVVSRLPLRLALESRALPLMAEGTRLIVAVDRLARLPALRALHVFEKTRVVPVLASKGQLALAMQRLAREDMWGINTPKRLGFVDTTTI